MIIQETISGSSAGKISAGSGEAGWVFEKTIAVFHPSSFILHNCLYTLLKLSRPLLLLLSALTYLLGASISVYLGKSLQLLSFFLGLRGLFAQLSSA